MEKEKVIKLVAKNTFKTLGQIFVRLAEEMEQERHAEEKSED